MNGTNEDPLMVSGQSVSLRSLVTDRIRVAIVTGYFRPGRQLRERELCEMTGVSRPSLREALRQLETEGLITTAPHRGPMVTSLTVEEVEHLYSLRRALESFAAKEFARRRSEAALEALRSATARLAQIDGKGSPLEMLEAGSNFYRVIAEGSGNPYLSEALARLHNRIKLIRFIALHDKDSTSESFRWLKELGEAVIDGDAAAAERICAKHLQGVSAMAQTIVANGYQLPGNSNSDLASF